MAIQRRGFLGALAVAPAALALPACAGAGARSSRAERTPPAARAKGPAGGGPAEAVRAFPLGRDAEPAFVFRAAAARPGER